MHETKAISWNDWLASRPAKRTLLKRYGLDAPSRRRTDYGKSGFRLRRAFGGKRVPEFGELNGDEK